MYGHLGFLEANLQILTPRINHEIVVFSTIVAITVLTLSAIILINHFSTEKTKEKALLAIADQSGGSRLDRGDADESASPMSMAFVKCLIASAQAKAVPLAPLRRILERLLDAGVADAEIPNRLMAAAGLLEELRSSLVNWQDGGPGHEHIRLEALAFVDRGDFESASEVLRRGRERGWTFPLATCREEAEFHAREAKIEHLQLRYTGAAENYATAAALVADIGGNETWRYLIEQARELCEDGREFGRHENILLAIEIYHRALGLTTRERTPLDWAATKHHLGGALLLLGERAKETGPLREAVEAYLAAIEEWTSDRAPHDWAKAQNNLGHALQMLGEQENDLKRLRHAAEAYRAALTGHTKESAPFEWVQAYNRLGDTLAVLGVEEGNGECLKEAVSAYREALDGINREYAPLDWAMTQNNLGKALEALGKSETGTGLLQQAVAAYQAALEERSRDFAPSIWAAANTNLGNALVTIAERENSNVKLEEAATAYREALAARPLENAPMDTAMTHINLAYTLGALWNRTRNRQALDEALQAVEAALGLIKALGGVEHLSTVELARETILAAMAHRDTAAA